MKGKQITKKKRLWQRITARVLCMLLLVSTVLESGNTYALAAEVGDVQEENVKETDGTTDTTDSIGTTDSTSITDTTGTEGTTTEETTTVENTDTQSTDTESTENATEDTTDTEAEVDTETLAETEAVTDETDTNDITVEENNILTDVNNETAGSVTLNSTTFPDEIFRKYIADTYDDDGNGMLSESEITSADNIRVTSLGIKSVKGIEYLSELLYLRVADNNLENLDISYNKKLKVLDCSSNIITNIDISKNTELTSIDISYNNIATINVSNNTKIESLYCQHNLLTALDVCSLTELCRLDCGYNNLTELNVSKNFKLEQLNINSTKIAKINLGRNTKLNTFSCAYTNMMSLDLRNNNLMGSLICAYSDVASIQWGNMSNYWVINLTNSQVSSIDVTKCPELAVLYCENNNITELDVTKCPKLLELYCSNNNLTKLDISNNTLLNKLKCSQNKISKLEFPNHKQLYDLYCDSNNLVSLDLSNTDVVRGNYYNNKRELSADKDGYVDLSVLEVDGFDITKTRNWSSNVVVDTANKKMKVDFSSSTTKPKQVYVTYHYNINNSYLADQEFILLITQYRTDIADAVIEMVDSDTYWGYEIKGIRSITYNGKELIHGGEYSIDGGGTNINAGTATVTINGINDFTGSVTKTFNILPAPISNAVLENIGDQTYTGSAITPNVSLKLHYLSTYMVKDKDYTLSYAGNTLAGTATVTVTGKGNYTGSVTTSFKINPSDIAAGRIEDIAEQTYTGKEVKPGITVIANNTTLVNGTDYDLSYSNNVNRGTATVTAIGKGNYTGSMSKTFKISIATIANLRKSKSTTSSIKLKWDKASGVSGYEIYSRKTGSKKYKKLKTIKKASTTTYTNKKLKIGTAYTYKIRSYKTINGKKQYGSYTILNTSTSMAKPVVKLTAGSKKATITYKKVSGANGYEVYMSTSKKGTYEKIKTLTKASKIKYTKRGLKKKKTYYFKVRAYKKVNGVKVYSSYSTIKKIKVK